jgi:DNA polymerase-3 subunit epsilon
MLVGGFDTETNGLKTATDHIIQIGFVLWDTDAPKNKAKIKYESLIKPDPMIRLEDDSIAIHGITNEDISKYGKSPKSVLTKLNVFFTIVDAVCAHNGNLFDKPMYESNCARYGIEPVKKLWIDTTCDVPYPQSMVTRKLTHLAAEHGFLNPFPHVALSDVLTMLKIADAYDWKTIFEYANTPNLLVRADTTYQQKDLAKKQGFRWDAESKVWVKSVKLFQFDDVQRAAQTAGFKVTILKGGNP